MNKVDTTAQTIASDLTSPNLIANTVSAAQVDASTMSAATFTMVNLDGTRVSATTVSANALHAQTARVVGDVIVSGRVQSYEYMVHSVDTSVAALSSVQASAKVLTAQQIHHILAVTTAQNEAVRLIGAHNGLVQYICNWATGSAKMFPPTGAQINSAAANAAYDLYPQSITMVIHGPTSSQFMAKRLTS